MRGRADGEPLLEHALLLAKALDRACGEVGTIGWGELVHQLRVASPLVCRLRADGNAGSLRRPRTLSSNGFGLRSGAEGLDLQLAGLQLELGVHAMQSRVDDEELACLAGVGARAARTGRALVEGAARGRRSCELDALVAEVRRVRTTVAIVQLLLDRAAADCVARAQAR